jgi:hypothetical protein
MKTYGRNALTRSNSSTLFNEAQASKPVVPPSSTLLSPSKLSARSASAGVRPAAPASARLRRSGSSGASNGTPQRTGSGSSSGSLTDDTDDEAALHTPDPYSGAAPSASSSSAASNADTAAPTLSRSASRSKRLPKRTKSTSSEAASEPILDAYAFDEPLASPPPRSKARAKPSSSSASAASIDDDEQESFDLTTFAGELSLAYSYVTEF